MADQIQIKDLQLRTIIGINEEERRDRQDVVINIVLCADTRAAGASDDIDDAVNYRTITKRVIRLVEESQFCLVERLAAEIAAICFKIHVSSPPASGWKNRARCGSPDRSA